MKHRPWILIFGIFALSCADEVPLPGRPCPCADGWTCCLGRNVCIPSTQFCEPAQQASGCPCKDGSTCCQAANVCIPSDQACGVPPEAEITHHPSRGSKVPCAEMETDEQGDGSMVQVAWTYVHDVWGNVTEMLGKRGTDATIDLDSRWFYDIYGNLTGREEYQAGALTYKRSTNYDPFGRVSTREIDADGDGAVDQRDSWDYRGPQPIRTTQMFAAGLTVATLRCTYSLRADGQPLGYTCVSLPTEAQAERGDYVNPTTDRRVLMIASDGINYDREIDFIRASGLVEIDQYSVSGGVKQPIRHFVVDAQGGTPSAWDLRDQTRPDLPHSTGTYKYTCQ